MPERWLRTNGRICGLCLMAAALIAVAGISLTWAASGNAVGVWLGMTFTAVGGLWCSLAFGQLVFPRIGYRHGYLLLYVGKFLPTRVPIEAVECFFLGQGPFEAESTAEVANVVIRLAESARQWHHIRARRSVARSCDGHITVRGAWCEPLSVELVNRMNRRLSAVKRQCGRQAL